MKHIVYFVSYKDAFLGDFLDNHTIYSSRKLAREAKQKYAAKGLKDYKIYKVTTEVVR